MSIDAAEAANTPAAVLAGAAGAPRAGVEAVPAAYAPQEGPGGAPVVSRSLVRQAVLDTLASWLARFGLAWLGLLAFFAVFAPFLANTHPALMKTAGHWSSPLLKNLTPADVILLIITAVVVVLAVTRALSFVQTVGTVLWFTALAALLTLWPKLPPWKKLVDPLEVLKGEVTLRSLALGAVVPVAFVASFLLFWFIGERLARRTAGRLHLSHRKTAAANVAWRVIAIAAWACVLGVAARHAPSRMHLADWFFGVDLWALVVLPMVIRPPARVALFALAGAAALAVLLILFPVRPPENVDYTQYREAVAAGTIQSALYAPIPYSPNDRLRDQPDARLRAPDARHWLGTDTNGADLLSNLIHASRIALSIGFISTGIAVVVGIIVGGFMGYYAGLLDLLGMRLIEIFEAIPRLFLLISVTAFIQQRNIYVMMTVIGLTGWTGYARFLRAEFFTIRKLDYVQAAIAAGLPRRSVLFRHMLPNGLTPILVSTAFGVASAILYESILSFLGIGLVDEASWGALLNQARAGGTGFIWWIAAFPGLAIFLTVFSYNLVGEAVRDALDPKLRKRD